MKRTSMFILLTIVSIVFLIIVVITSYVSLSESSTYPSEMWGHMGPGMARERMNSNINDDYIPANVQIQNSALAYFDAAYIILIAMTITGVCGAIYFSLISKNSSQNIATGSLPAANLSVATQLPISSGVSYDTVLKTLTSDERKIIQVLSSHDGKYLQKCLRSEAGLSRLQTHRVVTRLAKRGIVTLEKSGNTNTVSIASWLK
jgi:hypothetical protein